MSYLPDSELGRHAANLRKGLERALARWRELSEALRRASGSAARYARDGEAIAELGAALRAEASAVGLALVDLLAAGGTETAVAILEGAEPDAAELERAAEVPATDAEDAPRSAEPAEIAPRDLEGSAPEVDGAADEHAGPTPERPPSEDAAAGDALADAAHESEAAPAAAPRAPAVDVTPEMLGQLRRGLTPTLGVGTEPDLAASLRALDGIRRRLGRTPRELPTSPDVSREVGTLDAVTAPTELAVWAEMPARMNHALTSWVTTRARAAQEALDELGEDLPAVKQRVDGLFPRLSQHSRDSRPGLVYGLARAHDPGGGSWVADAEEWQARIDSLLGRGLDGPARPGPNLDDGLRELTEAVRAGLEGDELARRVAALIEDGLSPAETRLVNLVAPHLEDLEGDELAALRRAVREQRRLAEEEDRDGGDDDLIPDDWPYAELVRGRTAVIVGGDTRPEQAAHLREAFGFTEVDWLPDTSTGMRRAQSLVQRMKSGTVDFVIVLRAFSSHKLSDMVFGVKDARCHTVLSDGYGVQQIRLGLERFLASARAGGVSLAEVG